MYKSMFLPLLLEIDFPYEFYIWKSNKTGLKQLHKKLHNLLEIS